jgi:hypothetical protein
MQEEANNSALKLKECGKRLRHSNLGSDGKQREVLIKIIYNDKHCNIMKWLNCYLILVPD